MSPDLTLVFPRASKFVRRGELLVCKVTGEVICHCHDELEDYTMRIELPCEIARTFSTEQVAAFLSCNLSDRIEDFGPISFQRLREVILDRVAATDFKTLAGNPFLLDMQPMGTA